MAEGLEIALGGFYRPAIALGATSHFHVVIRDLTFPTIFLNHFEQTQLSSLLKRGLDLCLQLRFR